MKFIYVIAIVGFALVSGVRTANSLDDIMSQLDAITKKATFELGVQVNLSGKQRMLTQKMSKETLLISLGIDVKQNRVSLKKTIALFDKTLVGLRKGDASLDLVETTNKEILAQLQKVSMLWTGFKSLVDRVANGKMDKKTLQKVATTNLPLLAAMNIAVGMYEKISGADSAELAVVINLSGKQRMLTQKMTKEFLLIAKKIGAKENQQALVKSINLFDKTLKGLRDGDEDLGLPPTTDKKIRDQLGLVEEHWVGFYPILQKPASDTSIRQAAKENLPLLFEMNRAVKMYELSW